MSQFYICIIVRARVCVLVCVSLIKSDERKFNFRVAQWKRN